MSHESFIHFPASYAPPNISESECNSQQLALMEGLYIPKPTVLLALADQLENLRTVPPGPNPESGDGHGTKDETPKKIKLADTRDTLRKNHKSHKEKSQSKHSLTEKSPASSSHEHYMVHQASRLGDVVAQACLCCQDGEGSGKDPQLKDNRGPTSEAVLRKSLS